MSRQGYGLGGLRGKQGRWFRLYMVQSRETMGLTDASVGKNWRERTRKRSSFLAAR
jgi:hypothetical protein